MMKHILIRKHVCEIIIFNLYSGKTTLGLAARRGIIFCFVAAARSYVIIEANRKRPCLMPSLNLIMVITKRSGQLRASYYKLTTCIVNY